MGYGPPQSVSPTGLLPLRDRFELKEVHCSVRFTSLHLTFCPRAVSPRSQHNLTSGAQYDRLLPHYFLLGLLWFINCSVVTCVSGCKVFGKVFFCNEMHHVYTIAYQIVYTMVSRLVYIGMCSDECIPPLKSNYSLKFSSVGKSSPVVTWTSSSRLILL